MTYNHDLNRDGRRCCAEIRQRNNDEFLKELVAANEHNRKGLCNEVIQSNIPFVLDFVDRFLRRNSHVKHLKDDLTSECFLALTYAIRTFIPEKCSSLSNLLWTSCQHAAYRFVRTNHQLQVDVVPDVAYTPEYDYDVEDIIDTYCSDPLENQVVRLRLEGHREPDQSTEEKKPDISKVLGQPPSRVRNAWRKAKARLRKKLTILERTGNEA